ncbi:hypothetical protein ACVWXM_007148 [Bradyrhizobium sp. GM7.3]
MIEHGSFLQHQIMLTYTDKTQIRNVVTGPATGAGAISMLPLRRSTPDGQALRSVLAGREGSDFKSCAWK